MWTMGRFLFYLFPHDFSFSNYMSFMGKLGTRLMLLSGRVVCVATLPVMASRFAWGSWFKSAIKMPWAGRVNEWFNRYFNFEFIFALALVALHASFARSLCGTSVSLRKAYQDFVWSNPTRSPITVLLFVRWSVHAPKCCTACCILT